MRRLLLVLLLPATVAAQERDDDDDQLMDVAELYVQKGEHDRAIAIYDEILERRPADPAVVTKLAQACLGSEACAPRRRALLLAATRVVPDDPELLEDLAALLLEAGQSRKAIAVLRPFLRRHPEHAAIRAALVDALVAAGDHAAALVEVRAQLRRRPRDLETRWLEIELLEALGRHGERDRALLAYVADDPKRAEAWLEIADRALARGDVDGAEQAIGRARAGRFGDPEGHPRLAALEKELLAERAERARDRAERLRDLRRDARWADLEEDLEQGDDY